MSAKLKRGRGSEFRLRKDIDYYYREVLELRESKEYKLGLKMYAYRDQPFKALRSDFPNPQAFIARVIKPKRRSYRFKELFLPRPKRVYFLVTNTYDSYLKGDISGVQRVALELSLNLIGKKSFIPVYLNKDLSMNLVKIQKTSSGYNMKKLEFRKPKLRKSDIVFNEELDTSHTERLKGFFALCKDKGARTVALIHDIMTVKIKGVTYDFLTKEYLEYYKMLMRDADQVITISNHVRQDLEQLAKKSRIKLKRDIVVFHNGVEPMQQLSQGELSLVDEAAKDFFRDSKVFISVGTLQERKGYPDLVKAFRVALQENPKLKLCVAGRMPGIRSNSISRSFDKLTKEYPGNFIFLNGPNDATLKYIYSKCHCYVAASIDEGFGLPIVEASQYKPHILARDIEVFREIAGDNIEYFATNPELTAKILQIWTEPKSSYSGWTYGLTWQEYAQNLYSFLRN